MSQEIAPHAGRVCKVLQLYSHHDDRILRVERLFGSTKCFERESLSRFLRAIPRLPELLPDADLPPVLPQELWNREVND